MNSNMAIGKVIFIFCIVSFIGLAGCSDMSGNILSDDTEAAANFADAPAVVEVEHGTILGPPLVVPDDAPTIDIQAVFRSEPKLYDDGPWYRLRDYVLRFRITTSRAPQDDMVVLLLGTFSVDSNWPPGSFRNGPFRTFYIYVVIPKGETASNIYRTFFYYPKEIEMGIQGFINNLDNDDHASVSLSFKVIALRNPLPTLPLKAFLSDFIPSVEVPENYNFQLYKVAENAEIKAFKSSNIYTHYGVLDGDVIVVSDLLNSHLDPK